MRQNCMDYNERMVYTICISVLIIIERACLRRQVMENNMKEFVAYSRKLLRSLVKLRKLLDEGEYDEAKTMLDELIEDTQKDIEA